MDEHLTADSAKAEFRSHLIEGRYRQGEHLSVSQMAGIYKISRPVMRGFFEVLVSEGLLEKRGDVFLVFQLTAERIWQKYRLNHWIAREAPRRYLQLNPSAKTFPIDCNGKDAVERTERFYEIVADVNEGFAFAGVVRRNNALLHRMRQLKAGLLGDSAAEIDALIESLRSLDLPRYDALLDQYADLRASKIHDLVRISRQ